MPNSILPQDKDGQELYNSISSFFQTFGLGNLLRKCNAQKEKGVSVLDIFKNKLCNVFVTVKPRAFRNNLLYGILKKLKKLASFFK